MEIDHYTLSRTIRSKLRRAVCLCFIYGNNRPVWRNKIGNSVLATGQNVEYSIKNLVNEGLLFRVQKNSPEWKKASLIYQRIIGKKMHPHTEIFKLDPELFNFLKDHTSFFEASLENRIVDQIKNNMSKVRHVRIDRDVLKQHQKHIQSLPDEFFTCENKMLNNGYDRVEVRHQLLIRIFKFIEDKNQRAKAVRYIRERYGGKDLESSIQRVRRNINKYNVEGWRV